jgi:hypothetical protein
VKTASKSTHQLKNIFQRLDTKQDGELEEEELVRLFPRPPFVRIPGCLACAVLLSVSTECCDHRFAGTDCAANRTLAGEFRVGWPPAVVVGTWFARFLYSSTYVLRRCDMVVCREEIRQLHHLFSYEAPVSIYYTGYMVFSFLGYYSDPLFYFYHLAELFLIIPAGKDLMQTVGAKFKELIVTLFLGVVITYIYAVIGWMMVRICCETMPHELER